MSIREAGLSMSINEIQNPPPSFHRNQVSLPLFTDEIEKMKILFSRKFLETTLFPTISKYYEAREEENAEKEIFEIRVASNKDARSFPASRILGDAHLAQNKVCLPPLWKFCGFSRLYRSDNKRGYSHGNWKRLGKIQKLKLTKETGKLSGGKFLPSISRPTVNHLVRVENRIFSRFARFENWERQLQPYLYSILTKNFEREREYVTTLKYSTLNLNYDLTILPKNNAQ